MFLIHKELLSGQKLHYDEWEDMSSYAMVYHFKKWLFHRSNSHLLSAQPFDIKFVKIVGNIHGKESNESLNGYVTQYQDIRVQKANLLENFLQC